MAESATRFRLSLRALTTHSWLYLVHLPLTVILQAVVCSWQIPAIIKFALVCIVSSAILLASYQLLVRYTPIGALLNGSRTRPKAV